MVGLIVAHLLNDFVVQKNSWIEDKYKNGLGSKWLYVHGLSAGVLSYLFVGMWNAIWIPVVIALSHILLDVFKARRKDNLFYFTADQAGHLAVIVVIWLLAVPIALEKTIALASGLYSSTAFWVLLTAYIAAIWPAGVLIGKFTEGWRREMIEPRGLEKAGLWIGRLERFLVLTFIILRQFEIVGFLVAAKSIFRFGGIGKQGQREEAEYFLIGTLLSLSIAIVLGILVTYALEL